MPRDVPMTQDGFEDPDAFFKSPNNDTTVRSIATNAKSTEAGTSTKRGRMSTLAGEDSGEEYTDDLLEDLLMEDDEMSAGACRSSDV